MIDCSRTENYFIEKSRMTKQQKNEICDIKSKRRIIDERIFIQR